MSQKFYQWEIALLCGVVFALVWGAGTARAQGELADQVIRLHVIANSDTPEDQEQKLRVRDAILEQVEAISARADTTAEMEALLREQLDALERTAEDVLRANGVGYKVEASLTECWFPTKEYGAFAFPAGEYKALRLILGEGEGENWWCVAFPPLCVGASSKSVDEAVEIGYFTQEQGALIAQESDSYVLRFKSMELLGTIKGLFLQDE